uniref:Phytochromobilin:ferredoxin oxidoreductase, chloroplastic n=2 Tax=Glycine max TaxID=3847 RepID=K7M494_SOYBN
MGFRISSSSSSSCFCLQRALLPPLTAIATSTRALRRSNCIPSCSVSYQKFVEFALDETKRHTHLIPSPLQEKFSFMNSKDVKGSFSMLSFEAAKIRLLRSLIIQTETMQVLDFTVFPKAEYDVPIFCANFFTSAKTNIIVLDLNPVHDIINQYEYKEKYFKSLIPLGLKYAEVWLELICKAVKETDESQIFHNLEAQHRYLTWRAEKDPGRGVLKKLIGDTLAKDMLRSFLFNGVDELGSKTFNDYFPQYCCQEGNLNKKGNIIGKSFENRPWNARGEFIGSFSWIDVDV